MDNFIIIKNLSDLAHSPLFTRDFKFQKLMDDNKPVAIKQITKVVDTKYFNNEVNLMKKLKHPYILELIDVVKSKGSYYLILEYCNGGDLSKYISSNNSNNNYRYFSQILTGLEYLYKKMYFIETLNHKIY